ncbi:histidine kinase [Kineosporia mesophila]|uniref:histidine kinase n=1 Tax=Kineosporia mesophila TaxID=566012 RepID=A0ABP6ZRP5_9ACTN|nr:histidine kinase [Kineosporia mesophila]MCD5353672.1 histidine kinase [Kineosporia mesophila]
MDVAAKIQDLAVHWLGVLRRVVDRPYVMDIAMVLLVLAFAISESVHDEGHLTAVAGGFALALSLPLLWRRRRPAPVFVVIASIALLQWLTETPLASDVAVLIALHALGSYENRRRLVVGAALVAELGVVLAVVRWSPSDEKITSAILLTGTVTAALVLGVYSRTRRAYLVSVLERATTAERQRDQQAQLAVADERARISREMHDIVAHSLSVMIALSDGAAAAIRSDPDAAVTTMGQASTLGRQALGEVRRLLGDEPGPGVLAEPLDLAPQPGIAQLDDLVGRVRAAGLSIEFRVSGPEPALAPGIQLAIYRMVQEALTNVLKHAPAATRATVSLHYGSGVIDIQVENDDDPPPGGPVPEAETGRGLAGMRERAAVFGGSIEVGRRADGGWRVVSHLPVDQVETR